MTAIVSDINTNRLNAALRKCRSTHPIKPYEELKVAAIGHLRLCPGIELERFCKKLGLPLQVNRRKTERSGRTTPRSDDMLKLLEISRAVINALETEGAIELVAPSPPYPHTRVFIGRAK